MIKIKCDKIIVGETFFDGYIYLSNGKIKEITKEDKLADQSYDYTGNYLSAGFIDIHTHGAGGYSFIGSSETEVAKACDFHLQHGSTTILPTVSACENEIMEASISSIVRAKTLSKANILGAHLEGPYLSAKQNGAQSANFITPPKKEDYERIITKFGNGVTRWTFAPENDIDGEFCKYLSDHGVLASMGHTDAKYKDVLVALNNGCNLVTHLFSCTSTITRDHGYRSLGVIESAFLLDDLFVEIIADGKHLPPELIKMTIKIKGTDKVILCTDSLDIAGTDVKEGKMGETEFIVEDGVCKLKDRSAFAGSVATANKLIVTLVKDCGYSIPTAVKMLTENPAKLLKLNKGKIEKGRDADLVVFDDEINVLSVFVAGEKVV